MHSTKRLWTPEARARKHLELGPNTILAIMRHGCSILTATISRSFIKAKLIFIVLGPERHPILVRIFRGLTCPVVTRYERCYRHEPGDRSLVRSCRLSVAGEAKEV